MDQEEAEMVYEQPKILSSVDVKGVITLPGGHGRGKRKGKKGVGGYR